MDEKINERHRAVVATARRWLHDAGFKPLREAVAIDQETKHQDTFCFWNNGAVMLLEHERIALEGAISPVALYDIYRSVDEENSMPHLRQMIEAAGKEASES